MNQLYEFKILTKSEINKLNGFRQIRNNLLHGIETPDDNFLADAYQELREITSKVVNEIQDEEMRDSLSMELEEI